MRRAYDIDLRLCKEHNLKYHVKRGCSKCEKSKRLSGIQCPCCKGLDIEEGSINKNNGIIGPGYKATNQFPHLFCLECGVIFKNLKNNVDEK